MGQNFYRPFAAKRGSFSCEVFKISKNTFSSRTPPVAASVVNQYLYPTVLGNIYY